MRLEDACLQTNGWMISNPSYLHVPLPLPVIPSLSLPFLPLSYFAYADGPPWPSNFPMSIPVHSRCSMEKAVVVCRL